MQTPLADAAAAALALVGAAARDGHDRHGGGPCARGVARDAGQARVHHEGDAGDGEGGFGHVGGHDDLAAGGGVKDPALLGRGEPGEERQHQRPGRADARDHLAGLADVLLGGHEDEDVARAPLLQDVGARRPPPVRRG